MNKRRRFKALQEQVERINEIQTSKRYPIEVHLTLCYGRYVWQDAYYVVVCQATWRKVDFMGNFQQVRRFLDGLELGLETY